MKPITILATDLASQNTPFKKRLRFEIKGW